MGAYRCQYGTTHKMCRCPKEHKISCPTPTECQASAYQPKHRLEENND